MHAQFVQVKAEITRAKAELENDQARISGILQQFHLSDAGRYKKIDSRCRELFTGFKFYSVANLARNAVLGASCPLGAESNLVYFGLLLLF